MAACKEFSYTPSNRGMSGCPTLDTDIGGERMLTVALDLDAGKGEPALEVSMDNGSDDPENYDIFHFHTFDEVEWCINKNYCIRIADGFDKAAFLSRLPK